MVNYRELLEFLAFYKLVLWNITYFFLFSTSNPHDLWHVMTLDGITHLFILKSLPCKALHNEKCHFLWYLGDSERKCRILHSISILAVTFIKAIKLN